MSDLKKIVEEIYEMSQNNDHVAAMKKYYADDVVMCDTDGSKTTGLQANIERGEAFMSGVEDESTSLIDYVVTGTPEDGTVVSIWNFYFKHKDYGVMDGKQASFTIWKNGKVVHESFHFEDK